MERLILAFVLVTVIVISVGLIAQQDKDLDGPAPPITEAVPSNSPNSVGFSSDPSALFADGVAGAVGGGPPSTRLS
jgi:hypothetical protein